MEEKLDKFEQYLREALDHHVMNDNDDSVMALLDAIMEFQQLFRLGADG